MRTETLVTTVVRVSGRSGSLPKGQRWWCASEEAARHEQTPEPLQHPLHRGSYSGARDLACTDDMMEAEFGSSTAITNNANNRRGHAPKKIMIEAPVASTHWVDFCIVGTGMPAWEEMKNVECRM